MLQGSYEVATKQAWGPFSARFRVPSAKQTWNLTTGSLVDDCPSFKGSESGSMLLLGECR